MTATSKRTVRTLLFRAADDHGELIETDPTDLATYQQLVGGWIEAVALPDESLLICNEEGKINGLSPNRTANQFMSRINPGTLHGDLLVGDVVVVGPNSDDPSIWGPVTDATLDACNNAGIEIRSTPDR